MAKAPVEQLPQPGPGLVSRWLALIGEDFKHEPDLLRPIVPWPSFHMQLRCDLRIKPLQPPTLGSVGFKLASAMTLR